MLRLLGEQDSKHVTDIRRHTHTQGTSDSETFDNDLRAHAPPHCISSSFFFVWSEFILNLQGYST